MLQLLQPECTSSHIFTGVSLRCLSLDVTGSPYPASLCVKCSSCYQNVHPSLCITCQSELGAWGSVILSSQLPHEVSQMLLNPRLLPPGCNPTFRESCVLLCLFLWGPPGEWILTWPQDWAWLRRDLLSSSSTCWWHLTIWSP